MSGRKTCYAVLRAVSCMAIVLMHTLNISEILYRDKISGIEQRTALTGVYCLMWSVPVFVMVTGALLLDPDKNISISKIFSKYILRVCLALVFAVLFFAVFDDLMNGDGISVKTFSSALLKLIEGKSWSHLWYLYLLIGLYLLLPAYRAVAANVSEKEYRYLLAIFVIFLLVLPQLEYGGFKPGFTIQISAVYTFYFFAGHALSSGKIRIPVYAGVLLFLAGGILGAIFSFLGGTYLPGYTDPHLGTYSFPTVAMQAVGLFAALYSMKEKEAKIWNFLDANSFGIYLIHLIFLRLMLRYLKFDPFEYGAAAFAGVAFAAYAASLLTVWALRLIRPVRKVL